MKKNLLFTFGLLLMAFYAQAAIEVYTVYNSSNKTMTYYCDGNRASRSGEKEVYDPGNNFVYTRGSVEHVVIDASMQNYNKTTMKSLFSGVGGFTKLKDITGIANLNTSNVTNMEYMFYGCEAITTIDISGFDFSKVTNTSYMFENCKALKTVTLKNKTAPELLNAARMFANCQSITSVNMNGFIAAKLQNVTSMFAYCYELTSIDVYANTDNIKYASSMFHACSKLTSVSNLWRWIGKNTQDVSYMFSGCSSITKGYFGCHDNISALKNMEGLFQGCWRMTEVEIESSIITAAKLENMSKMFQNCEGLKEVDLTYFVFNQGVNVSYMFEGCKALTTIKCESDLSTRAGSSESMFYDCEKLVGNNGTKYNSSYKDKTYARPDRGTRQPGYFTTDLGPLPPCATPKNVKWSNVTQYSATVSWEKGESDQTKWELVYYEAMQPETSVILTKTSYTLTGLTPDRYYLAKVRAVCGTDDYSEFTEPEFCLTNTECKTPSDFKVVETTHNSITLSWTKGSEDQKKWKLYYSITNTGAKIAYPTTNYYTLTDLEPNTYYTFKLQAICNDGVDESMIVTTGAYTDKEPTCDKPYGLKATSVTDKTATLVWEAQADMTRFEVSYTSEDKKEAGTVDIMDGVTHIALENLKPETKYYVKVAGWCEKMSTWSEPSEPCEFTTLVEEVPEVQPGEEGLEQIDGQSVTVRKVLRDGQLFIERNGKIYQANGAQMY